MKPLLTLIIAFGILPCFSAFAVSGSLEVKIEAAE